MSSLSRHDTAAPRLHRLRRLMRARGCTHVLISDPVDARYVSGFASSNVSLLIGPKSDLLCTDFRYRQAAEIFCRGNPRWRLVLVREGDFSHLRGLVPRGARLGVQSNVISLDQYAALRRVLPGVRLVSLGTAVSETASVVKTAAEVAVMARCARIASRALRRTLPYLREGVTERRVRDLLEQHCRELGSEGPAFETIVLFGRRTALPHGVPGNTRLASGDFVLFDFGCTLKGLRSDMTRTFVKGTPSRRQRGIYATVLAAQTACRRAIRAGMRAADADRLARDIIERAGYGTAFGHATGHGVGYRIHEAPRLAARNTARLEAGSVVTVEPGIYFPSLGGVRIEDMVVLTKSGRRVLTAFPRHLMKV